MSPDILKGITAGTSEVFDPNNPALLGSDDEAPSDPFNFNGIESGSDEEASESENGGEEALDSEVDDGSDTLDTFSDDEEAEESEPPRKRVKIDVPQAPSAAPGGKYIPPSMRRQLEAASQPIRPSSLTELTRKVRGLLNRVSEGNMVNVSSEIQTFFTSFTRHGEFPRLSLLTKDRD